MELIIIENENKKYIDLGLEIYERKKNVCLRNCKIIELLKVDVLHTLILKDCEIKDIHIHYRIDRIIIINSKIHNIDTCYNRTFISLLYVVNSYIFSFGYGDFDKLYAKLFRMKLKNSIIENNIVNGKKKFNKRGFYDIHFPHLNHTLSLWRINHIKPEDEY